MVYSFSLPRGSTCVHNRSAGAREQTQSCLCIHPCLWMSQGKTEKGMTAIFGEDGKELTQTLAVSLYADFPILYLLLHCSQRDVFPIDFRGSRSQQLIRIRYDKAQSSLTLRDHGRLEAKKTAPAQGSVSLR